MSKKLISNIFSETRALKIIQQPILTEKSTNLNQFNQYSFRVDYKATSLQIKKAIQYPYFNSCCGQIFSLFKNSFKDTLICS